MADQDGVNIPLESTADTSGFDAIAAAGVQLGARLKELQAQEIAASAPVAPPVSAPGTDKAVAALRELEAEEAKVSQPIKPPPLPPPTSGPFSSALKKLRGEADEFTEHLTQVFTFSAGTLGAEAVLATMEDIKEKVSEVIHEGINYNAEVETSVNSLASTLRSAEPEIYRTRDAAKNAAQEVFGQIRDFATNNGLGVKATFEAYSANYNAFVEAGARDTQKQIEFVSTIIAAEASKGISGAQGLRDAIDLLQGRFERITFAKEIGATVEGFKEAAAQGKQLDYILSRVGGYKEGIGDYAESFAGLSQQVHGLTEQLEGLLLKGSFGPAKEGLSDLATILKDPGLRTGVENFGNGIGKIISFGAHLGGDAATGAQKLEAAMNALFPKLAAVVGLIEKLGEADPLKAQLDTNARLIDMATTQEQQARVRQVLVKQIADAEQDGNQKALDALLAQQRTLQDNLGKHNLTADAAAAAVHLTEAQRDALKDIGAALDAQNLKEQDKGAQLSAQLQSLNEQITKASEYTGLQRDIVENIRTSDDFQRAGANLTEQQRAVLAEYLAGIISTRAEVDKLAAAADKEGQKQIQAYRDVLASEAEQADRKKELQRITDYLASTEGKALAASAEGTGAINKLKSEQAKLTDDIATAEKKLEDQRNKAFPEEIKQLQALREQLQNLPTTGTEATADARGDLQSRIRALEGVINGTNRRGGQKSLDDLDRESLQRAANGNAADAANAAGQDAAAGNLDKSAEATAEATQKTADAAAKLTLNTGALAPALSDVKSSLDSYHKTNADGLQAIAQGTMEHTDALTALISGQQDKLEAQASAISQLQIRIDNLATDF